MPNMPIGLNANFGDQLYLNAGNDAPVNDPLADQAAPVAAAETEKTGNVSNVPLSDDICPEIALAAVDETNAVIQHDGKTIYAPMSEIDVDKVELSCDGNGCVLVPNDGDPTNDIIVPCPEQHRDEDGNHI